MGMVGLLGLLIAFAAAIISIVCLLVGQLRQHKGGSLPDTLAWAGRIGMVLAALALTVCCGILVWAFMTGDMTLNYVLHNHSDASGPDAWLFQLAGLWAGRQGSLLFWAWLISIFGLVLALRTNKASKPLDNMALMVLQLVLLAFVSVLLFSQDNMPFTMTDPSLFQEDGSLTANASMFGMNSLLEHWAMAIHPPTLFIGYAGLTVPFAYAIAALIVNDDSPEWVIRCTPYALFSWLFLGIGIGLGAIWAYVVLGWGGYWGWDPVENASLLPWLIGVALIHSFTAYRTHGTFKRWSVMCACIAFSTVVLGTFITRSGLVQSVHAFNGDSVSLVLFLVLIIASLLAGAIGLVVRRKTFGVTEKSDGDLDSVFSREAAYYINNLILIVFTVLLAYMTISSALPSFLPFGGQSLSAGTYNAIARPLTIIYGLLIAVCPLVGWRRTDKKAFWKKARIPGICAIVLFAVLMVYYCTYLLPSYNAIIEGGGSAATGLLEQGAPIYYNGIAVVGFAVASVLFFNALFMLVKSLRAKSHSIRNRFAAIGGSMCHLAIGVIIVGLVGSSMYVTEVQEYVPYDEETDTASSLTIQDFELTYVGNSIEPDGADIIYSVEFDVTKDGQPVGTVSPSVQLTTTTQQQKLNAAVLSFPLEDLFVVYRGVNNEGAFSMDVRVNPLISVVWVGFALLMLGSVIALFAKRRASATTQSD